MHGGKKGVPIRNWHPMIAAVLIEIRWIFNSMVPLFSYITHHSRKKEKRGGGISLSADTPEENRVTLKAWVLKRI